MSPRKNRPLTARRNCNILKKSLQWTHLQLISFAIAHVVLLIVHLLKRRSGGAIANESTVQQNMRGYDNERMSSFPLRLFLTETKEWGPSSRQSSTSSWTPLLILIDFVANVFTHHAEIILYNPPRRFTPLRAS